MSLDVNEFSLMKLVELGKDFNRREFAMIPNFYQKNFAIDIFDTKKYSFPRAFLAH